MSSIHPLEDAPVRRTRTPPDVKWLLNERAALAGEHARAAANQLALHAKRERLEKQLYKVVQQIGSAQTAAARAQASLDALDATMGLVNACLEPSAAGVVCAWAGKYGKRGALGAFVEEALRQAAPAPLTTTVLINLASQHFGIAFALPKDRLSLRKSVGSGLTSLLKRGLIEPLHDRHEGSHGIWRWQGPTPTLAALQLQAAAMET
jgi:hypothetical protein